jgi:hypothetical protein
MAIEFACFEVTDNEQRQYGTETGDANLTANEQNVYIEKLMEIWCEVWCKMKNSESLIYSLIKADYKCITYIYLMFV